MIEDLPLEERLTLAVLRFARENNAKYDINFTPVSTFPKGAKQIIYIDKLMLRVFQEGQDSSFLATIDRDKDGNFEEPVYLSQGTKHGNLYEKFCEFVREEPFSIRSKPAIS